MSISIVMRIAAEGNNATGDLLTRLATDVFEALGYEKFRLNIHKSGRELDISASHKLENRTVVAECKAHSKPIGGGDINKFAGVLDVERRTIKSGDVTGYFLSLSGFTETALEQEQSFSPQRLITLNGEDMANILVDGKTVVSPARAAEISGRFVHEHKPNLKFIERLELIGTPIGWVWGVHFGDSGTTSAVCLVHADGEVVSSIAEPSLKGVTDYPVIFRDGARSKDFEERFKPSYFNYLSTEYGKITLEGMPADQQVGSKTFMLEHLYVPINLIDLEKKDDSESASPKLNDIDDIADLPELDDDLEFEEISGPSTRKSRRGTNGLSVGQVMANHSRIAILGPPGSGKTTILKRLCMAFSDPSRSSASDDDLPPYEAFPIVVRCRQLGSDATRPISQILDEVVVRAEMQEFAKEFSTYLRDRLHAGSVVLLVDGLDEIPAQSDRAAFVAQLRTFVGRYPTVKLIVTSREVGFRIIAGAVGSICRTYRVDELSDENILLLCKLWHKEVLGDRPDVEIDAAALADSIVSTDRVRRLAVNPLLLTTLLLVKRWIGQLPRRRTVLYQKAIEVLLMTWNVESHDPIDPEEALPQLAFAAYRMMVEGKASVTSPELAKFFVEARGAVPEVLAYAKTSVHEFIELVEERSSLLIQSGQRIDGGQLRWVYEFKHLTFQEYLCALAIVNGYIPANVRSKEPSRLLGTRLKDPRWREVVAITAVLAGRNAVKIIDYAMEMATKLEDRILKSMQEPGTNSKRRLLERRKTEHQSLLGNIVACLSDEVPMAPDSAKNAINFIIRRNKSDGDFHALSKALAVGLPGGRYESILRESISSGLREDRSIYPSYVFTLSEIVAEEASVLDSNSLSQDIASKLASSDVDAVTAGTTTYMVAAYHAKVSSRMREDTDFPALSETDLKHFAHEVSQDFVAGIEDLEALDFARVWALSWSIHLLKDDKELNNQVQLKLLNLWRDFGDSCLSDFAAWALRCSPPIGSWEIPDGELSATKSKVFESLESKEIAIRSRARDHLGAAAISSYYLNILAPEKIAEVAVSVSKHLPPNAIDKEHLRDLLTLLKLPAGNPFEAEMDDSDDGTDTRRTQ